MASRPFNEKDLLTNINGDPVYLGTIVSTGAVQNNASTVTPFSTPGLGGTANPNTGPANLQGTLAGKTLLLQTTAAGSILSSNVASVVVNASPAPVLALQSVVPPLAGTSPGPLLSSAERVVLIMAPLNGWLQWLPTSGAGNLHVWELR